MNPLVNSNYILGLSFALAGLFAAGCATPAAVKNLARETQRASTHMANLHERDLQTLAAYDQNRVAQFNRLLGDYFALRSDMARAFNDVLKRSKLAALAELDQEFNKRAEELLAVDFWVTFRENADGELNEFLRRDKERAGVKLASANGFPRDGEALNQALVAARQLNVSTALKYESVEKSYAEMIKTVRAARNEFHADIEKRLAKIDPIPTNAAPGVNSFALTNNAAEIEKRIKELREGYRTIDKAHGVLGQYLDEYNPAADFFVGVGQAFVGVTNTSENGGSESLSTTPKDPKATQLPGMDDLFNALAEKTAAIDFQKTEGANTLQQSISVLTKFFVPKASNNKKQDPANTVADNNSPKL